MKKKHQKIDVTMTTAKATPAKAKQPKKVVTEELRKLAKRVL